MRGRVAPDNFFLFGVIRIITCAVRTESPPRDKKILPALQVSEDIRGGLSSAYIRLVTSVLTGEIPISSSRSIIQLGTLSFSSF